jgi:hypothetical protein
MRLSDKVTRAEFSKMLVAASSQKDSIGGGSGFSQYSDVRQSHWAVEYIRTAVENGWFVGYSDGSFRPDNGITLEEGATAVLRLLGYDSETLAGSYPTAQLSKYEALGLGEGVNRSRGQTLLRSDCMRIFIHLMTAKTRSGSVYAATLGYPLTASGELDYAALVSAGMKGPYVLEPGGNLTSLLPFTGPNVSVYRNGRAVSLADAGTYDVYYYNGSLRSVWLYDERVAGILTAVSPNDAAPASVTVAGNSYSIGTPAAAYKLSSMGLFAVGDAVTLLLGMDGAVADVVAAGETDGVYYGVVTENGTGVSPGENGREEAAAFVRVTCTDGAVRQYGTGGELIPVGSLVSVSYTGGQSGVKRLSAKSLSGRVDAAGANIGDKRIAADAQILDTNGAGAYKTVLAARLAGANLKSGDVRYYALDEDGSVSRLILNDVTGDLYAYGLLTGVSETSLGMNVAGVYSYVIDGKPGVLNTSGRIFNVTNGGAVFRYKGGAVDSIRNLSAVPLDSLTGLSAVSGEEAVPVSEEVQVYIRFQTNGGEVSYHP